MSPTSYRTALPRDVNGAGAGIRTQAPLARPTGFQDRTLQPLGYSCNSVMVDPEGLEPIAEQVQTLVATSIFARCENAHRALPPQPTM